MNIRLVLNLLGKALMVEGAAMAPSIVVSLIYGGADAHSLGVVALLTCAVGYLLTTARPRNVNMRAREGFASVALIWFVMSFFGGLPFYISGAIPSLVDCFFESVSGFTTTGATILKDVEALPRGLLFWRSFTHWIGGMGVLVLALALVPKIGARAQHLLHAESTGPNPGKILPRIGQTAKRLYKLYVGLTIIEIIALLICGLDLYDALIHAFGTAGTGGFSNYNASVQHFASPSVDMVISTFMLLFGVNFSLYHILLLGRWREALRSEELRVYLSIVGISVLIIAVDITGITQNFLESLRQSYFQVSSIITTTGFATADFDRWPELSRGLLVSLMLIGACAGSTGGGIKVVRIVLNYKSIRREIDHTIRPNAVKVVKYDGHPVEEQTLAHAQVFFFVYLSIIALATLIVSLDGFSFDTNLTAAISATSNIGPGLGMVGPTCNFSIFSSLSKIVLSVCMLVGRLEIYPVLMLFMPSLWRRKS